jgi:penicillin-binding protein 1C
MKKIIHSKRIRFLLYLLAGAVFTAALLFLMLNWLFPLPVEKLHRPASMLVLDRNGEWLRAFTAPDDSWRIYEPSLDELSPKLREAVLTYEDRWFYRHIGVNPLSILQAAIDNIKAKRVVRGGSTMTMQVARMMEPKGRTIPNKLIEVFRAFQLELKYSKAEILTHYFNMAPYGGNIVGSSAAARIYFNKSQSRLSLGESALLAAIPNSPTLLRPDVHPKNARKAREKVLQRMLKYKKINERELREALSEPIPTKRYPMPFKAPHLTRLLFGNSGKQQMGFKAQDSRFRACPDPSGIQDAGFKMQDSRYKSQDAGARPRTRRKSSIQEAGFRGEESTRTGRIYATIDTKIQELSERVLREQLAPLRQQGISTGAIIVMDTKTREVLAMVGSYDFFDESGQGQVNGTLATRSPGSALKPFVYALAIDRGLITPESLLHDVPVDYSGYNPVNYNGKHRGYITAREALEYSLNVPAVNLCAQLGNDGIYPFLKRAGISTLTESQEHYGLSLVLGGCGVTLLELTTLYAGLANFGEFAPYRLTREQSGRHQVSAHPSARLLSRGASFILTEMLTEVRRPDLPAAFEASMNLPQVAWKTGTSYGHRDAWSIGYTPEYTVGVWVGNFDGRGVPSLVGSEAAAPILFALFNALTTPATNRWFTPPPRVNTRKVCALSGMPLTDHCPALKLDDFIPNVSPHERCSIHKRIDIDGETGVRLCSHCRIGRKYRQVVFEEWPPEITTWLNRNGFAIPTIPPHTPDCSGLVAGHGPIIRSPSEESEYHIRQGVPLEYQKLFLEASVSNRTKKLFWFLNGQLIFSGDPTDKVFLTPAVGTHTLTCVDDEGRSTSRRLVIKG